MKKKIFISIINVKKGMLRRQLNIPSGRTIPNTLLIKIIRTKTGKNIINPTKTGKRIINITTLLKKRAVLTNNFRNFPRKKIL